MAAVTPPLSPTTDVGNDVDNLEGLDSWTSVQISGTSFTIDSPIDPEDGGTRLVFHGTFTGTDGNMPASGTIESIDIIYIDETGAVFTMSSTWDGFTPIDLQDFKDWIDLDNTNPPDTDMGEVGAGAAAFTDALFGGADTITGTTFADSLFGYAGNDLLISGGLPGGEYEMLNGGAGDDVIRIQGDYGDFSEISGGADTDTLEIVDGNFANGFLRTDLSDLLSPTGLLSGFEAVTFAAPGNSQILFDTEQVGTGLMTGTVITGDAFVNVVTFLASTPNDPGDTGDTYDLTFLTDPSEFNFTFANWSANDVLAISVADPASLGLYRLVGNNMNNAVTGGAGNNVLLGGGGNDTLFGGFGGTGGQGGADFINGEAGDDVIYSYGATSGGAGIDTLLGGTGSETLGDTLVVWTNESGVDFSTGNLGGFERLVLSQFPGAPAPAALSAIFRSTQFATGFANNLVVTGSSFTDAIRIDVDATTANLDLHNWTFTNWNANLDEIYISGSNAANNLVGTTVHDYLQGNGGADNLYGGLGNDTLSAGIADGVADHFYGGDGNDIYGVIEANDIVHELSGEGASDLVAVTNLASYTLTANVENLALYGTATNGTGNELANAIEGNATLASTLSGLGGDDFLFGGDGADVLIGGAGEDELYGDDGVDTASYINALAGVTASLATGGTVGDALGDVFVGVENLTGSDFADTLTGDSGSNTLAGGLAADFLFGAGGADILIGNNGADVLDGGGGADEMRGGKGRDTYIVNNAGDITTENSPDGGIDTVESSVTRTLGVNFENLTLTGTAVINGTGNTQNNIIIGNTAANIIDGGAGADDMNGGLGNDTYIVDNAGDITTETSPTGGTDLVQSSVTRTLGLNLENLTLTGAVAINGYGNALNNTIIGNGAANFIDGGAGADNMNGGLGNDVYVVDNAGDITTESSSTGGTDLVQSSVTRTLGANLENLTLTGSALINGTGNTLNNTIVGNSVANALSGGDGADTLNGGLGNDLLTGGAAADIFVFNTAPNAATNRDTIADFNIIDTIQLENAVFVGLGAGTGTLAAAAFFVGASAADASDRIIYNAANGALYYDADGLGGVAQIQFATLTGAPAITNADFVII